MKRGTPRHVKTFKLASLLSVPLPMAVGILEMLWHFAGDCTPMGDIGSIPDREIANAVGWEKRPSALVDALCSAGWLERNDQYRLIVHDWPEHAEYEVFRKLQRNGKDFLGIYGVITRKSRADSGNLPGIFRESSGKMRASREAMAIGLGSESKKLPPAIAEKPLSEPDLDIESRYQAYKRRHPGAVTRDRDCRSAYTNIVLTAPDPFETQAAMDRIQSAWIEYWRKSKTLPLGLFNFLVGGDCVTEPPVDIPERPRPKSKHEQIMDSL